VDEWESNSKFSSENMANIPTTLSALTAQNETTQANQRPNDLIKMRDNNDKHSNKNSR
jgi:hypothetical protein